MIVDPKLFFQLIAAACPLRQNSNTLFAPWGKILLATTGDTLVAKSAQLSWHATASMVVEDVGCFRPTVVPVERFEILKAMPFKTVAVSSDITGDLVVTGEEPGMRTRSRLEPWQNGVEDFPTFSPIVGVEEETTAKELLAIISEVAPSASKDQHRPQLNDVFLSVDAAVATDGLEMAMRERFQLEKAVQIDASLLTAMKGLLMKCGGDATVIFIRGEAWASLRYALPNGIQADFSFETRVQFPDWRRVQPENPQFSFSLPAADLRLAVAVSKKYPLGKLMFVSSGGQITLLSSGHEDYDGTVVFPAITVPDFQLAVNAAKAAGQGNTGKKRSPCRSNVGVGGTQLVFGSLNVGAIDQQLRWQAGLQRSQLRHAGSALLQQARGGITGQYAQGIDLLRSL